MRTHSATALILLLFLLSSCAKNSNESELTELEKSEIRQLIEKNIYEGLEATRNKDIETYISRLPEDLLIYDESGEVITREKQREYALQAWAIIDTTLYIEMVIDSMKYLTRDSVIVFTSQKWKRMMFQRDGITLDTILTTQIHKETWKNKKKGWFSYDIVELGGKVFINGESYLP
jgi:hypothetical protein